MNWNDWEAVWRRQEPPIGAAADVTTIRDTFEAKRRKRACTVLLRNGLEGGTGAVVTGALAWLSWRHGTAGWPLAVSATLVFAVSGVFIVDLIRSRRSRVGPEASLLAKIDAEIGELRHQRRLIRTWWAWYLVPLVTAIVIAFAALARLNHGKAPPGLLVELLTTPATLAWIIIFFSSMTLPLCRVWRANRQAIENVQPRLDELEKLRRYMLSGEGGSWGC